MTVTAAPGRVLNALDAMSAPVVSVSPHTSIGGAWSVMSRTGLRHLTVTVGQQCVGVVDDRSVFAQWPMGPLSLRRRTVAEIMRPSTTCVLPATDLQSVANVMVTERVDAVPVVDAAGALLGIVTGSDIASAVARCGIRDTAAETR